MTDSPEPNAEEGGEKPEGETPVESAAEATEEQASEPAAEATPPEPAAEQAPEPAVQPSPEPVAAATPAPVRPRVSGPAPATPGLNAAQKGLLIVGLILLIGIQAAILFSRDSHSPTTPYMPPPPAASEVAQHSPEPAGPGTESPAPAIPDHASPAAGSPDHASPAAGSPEPASPAAGSPELASPAAGSPEPASPAAGSPEPASPAAASPEPASPAAVPMTVPAGATTVQATVSDNGLETKDLVAPARREVYIVVSNTGKNPYSLRIEGVGELDAEVAPGGQGTMKVVLGPGSFTVRVPGHEGSPAFNGRIVSR